MTPTAAVKARLLMIGAVTALVGTRIYVDKAPQEPDFPLLRLHRISKVESAHLRGSGAAHRARVQVDAIARSLEAATALSDAAHGDGGGSGLSGWTGEVGSPATRILAILPADDRSDYEGEEVKQWRVSRDYVVWLR